MKAIANFVIRAVAALLLVLAARAAEPRTFEATGIVREVRPAKGELLVQHDTISGFMDAMTMPFKVHDPRSLQDLKPGDAIAFRLHVTDTGHWIDEIKTRGSKPGSTAVKSAPALDPLRPGDPLPDLAFTDEHGRPLHLASTFRGQALAFTFLYTRCPLPDFCPLLTQKFRTVQKALLADPNAPANWRLLAVTIDPAHDTPEVLRRYAAAQEANEKHWRFATGELRDITILALRCGLEFWEQSGTITHGLRTVVADASGKVRRIFIGNEWSPDELAAELREAAK